MSCKDVEGIVYGHCGPGVAGRSIDVVRTHGKQEKEQKAETLTGGEGTLM